MIVHFLKRLARDRRGGTAIEYGLILALVVLAIFAALLQLADITTAMWNNMDRKVQAATVHR